jgi:hypothetical protein
VAHGQSGEIIVTSGTAVISPAPAIGPATEGVQLPTSVLLAVLAAAGLLALAPALVRRYDAAERLEAERAQSSARVLSRTRRRRTVPRRWPVNPSRILVPTLRVATPVLPAPADPEAAYAVSGRSGPYLADRPRGKGRERGRVGLAGAPRSAPPAARQPGPDRAGRPTRTGRATGASRASRPRYSPAVYRRRRVLAALLLLNVVELVGILAVGPGFWVGFAVTGTLLLAFVVHLRNLALADRRRRHAEARRRAWLAERQAAVRLEQERRAAQRRAAARRLAGQRESLRRTAADGWSAPPTVSYRRARTQ